MQVHLSSENYDILASGEAFLFKPDADLTIQILEDDGEELKIVMKFTEDASGKQAIQSDVTEDSLIIRCINFTGLDMGLRCPAHIAEIDGKEVSILFSSKCSGEKKVRSVKYTVFREK